MIGVSPDAGDQRDAAPVQSTDNAPPVATPKRPRASRLPKAPPKLPFGINEIHEIDAIVGLKALPDESIDLIVTDPPYNIASKNKTTVRHGKIVSTAEAWGAWDTLHPFDYDILISQLISEAFRVLVPGGALYVFTAREQNGFFIRKALERGFTYRNQLVIVKKSPLPSFAKTNFRSGYETCFYVTKGKPRLFDFVSQRACLNVHAYANGKRDTTHPAEKPFAFIELLVTVSSKPGDIVLDPFMGSGTTALAARNLGRWFIGFERDPVYIEMARARLAATESDKKEVSA